jgi:hypothetical protein
LSVLTLLYSLLYIILLLLSIILLATIIPLSISFLSNVDGFNYDTIVNFGILSGAVQGSASFNPEGGAFKLRLFWLPVYGKPLAKQGEKTEEQKTEKPRHKRRSPRKIIGPIQRLLNNITRIIKVRKLDIDLTTGLSDPYILGLTLGATYPIIEMMKVFLPPLNFSLTPNFTDEKFMSQLDARISLRAIFLVIPLIRFLISREYREYRRS